MAEKKDRPVRVRMAPSPTGPLHIGTARTTLFNYLFARHEGGTFILRIEDTDKERSSVESEKGLLEGLHWLGIEWDEGPDLKDGELISKGDFGPYRDSERIDSHKKYIQKFLAEGKAYQCYCTKEELEAQRQESEGRGVPFRYPGTCRNLTAPPAGKMPQVIRLRMPDETISFEDMIRGTVSVAADQLDDFAIARSDGSPLYNFAVAVDDYEMQISHIVRGEDHISNTPKQIAVYRALGAEPPLFAHIPLILNPDRSKMSKRFGDTTVAEFRAKGYLPDALVNFLTLLGWHPQDDREIMSRAEAVKLFDISRVQKAGAVFDEAKLDWLNREYIKRMDAEALVGLAIPFLKDAELPPPDFPMETGAERESFRVFAQKVITAGQSRATTLRDFAEQGRFFFELPDYAPELLVWKNMPRDAVSPVLDALRMELAGVPPEGFTIEKLQAMLEKHTVERKKGEVFWPLRVALSGLAASPDPIEIMSILGKGEALRRIDVALEKMRAK